MSRPTVSVKHSSPSDFQKALVRWLGKVENRRGMLFRNVAGAVKNSITDGSPVTGAPGQPVDTGYLKGSWQLLFEGQTVARIVTNCAYAPVIEEGNRAAYNPAGTKGEKKEEFVQHIKSTVGGHHSVKMTRANYWALVLGTVHEMGIREDQPL